MQDSVTLTVDGRPVRCAAGVTLAAVIAAQGFAGCTRRSVLGQPRAPLCGMGVCQECRVDVDGRRRLACQTMACEGMQVGALCALPAAGLAAAAVTSRDTDLLIVGAGPAGLAAARAAASSGMRILVLDDNPAPGGQVWRQGVGAAMSPALREVLAALKRHSNVELMSGARVAGRAAGERALLVEQGVGVDVAALIIRFQRIVLCTGAREQLLPFAGWTLPGVSGAGGLQALVKGGMDVRGQRIVVAGSGPLLLAVAATLHAAHAHVLRIAEQAPLRAVLGFAAGLPRWPRKLLQAAQLADPCWRAHSLVVRAEGDDRLRRVVLQRSGRREEQIDCDRLACGFGLAPNTELAQLLGCTLAPHDGIAVDARQATSAPDCFAAGECTGIGGAERAALQGAIAGHAVAGDDTAALALRARLARWQAFADVAERAFALRPAVRSLAAPDTIVCRCEDVPLAAVQAHDGWVAAKLASRCGMGPCQGRVCGTALRVMRGWPIAPPRQLLQPVSIGALAGADVEV